MFIRVVTYIYDHVRGHFAIDMYFHFELSPLSRSEQLDERNEIKHDNQVLRKKDDFSKSWCS